jgi:hypothetical protein
VTAVSRAADELKIHLHVRMVCLTCCCLVPVVLTLLLLVGMALHGGATLADNELEVSDFDFDDEEEARAAGYFDKTREEVPDLPTPNTSGQNLLSMLKASP